MGKQGTRNVVLQPESWYAVQDTTVYPLEDADLVRLLDNADVTLDVFNSAPLYAKAMAAGGWGSSIVWDGKLAAYLLDASASKYQISELIPAYKAAAAFTCTDYPDAGRLADLFARMKAEITACGEDALYNEIEFPLAQVLADMTRTGVLVDKDGIEQFGVKLREELEQVLTRIHMETGSATFNPNSPKQLGEMLFDTMGLPHGKKTQRGWSTDAETLESLREYPLVEDVLQYRAYQKLNSTYVEGLLKVIGEDGRIHSTFNQTEARTGRLSSDNPNLQNIPIRTELGSQLRAYFVAKPGCVLVDADYSQIELRILAHITGDEHMQQAFLNGEDIHRSTAAKIYGIPQSEVTPRLRSSAKAINFGIMYGKGAYSLSKDIGVTVKEADAFLKNYLAAFPSVSGYMDKTIADAKANGYVSTLFGRRRALPELASSNFNVRSSGCTALALAAMLYAVVFGMTDTLVGWFNSENSVQMARFAHNGMRLYFVGYFFAGFNIVAAGYLSATNRPVEASVTSICRGVAAIVVCSLVMSALFGMNGVWAAFPAAELLTALLTLFLLLRKKKQTV
mgnify:CR=1 FL=1